MELIRENIVKKRKVFRTNSFIRKYWYDKDLLWVQSHATLLESIIPNYVLNVGEDHSGVFLDMKIVEGIPASNFPHNVNFVKRIYNFCLNNIKETSPYVHGDWTLSNMIINDEKITMVDWDNVGIYSEKEIQIKLESDLVSAFGHLYYEALKNDTTGI
jgi:RIO-like serine/threonine protein kinase